MKYSIEEVYKIRKVPPPYMTEAGTAEGEAPSVDTAGIPEAALRAKSLELGVSVSDLTPEQVEEVRSELSKSKPVKEVSTSLPKSKPKPKKK